MAKQKTAKATHKDDFKTAIIEIVAAYARYGKLSHRKAAIEAAGIVAGMLVKHGVRLVK